MMNLRMGRQHFRSAVTSASRFTILLFACATGFAQNAVVSGRVTDSSGGVIPNVAVELINNATQIKSPTMTNGEGIFVFPSVPPGAYEVNARITGFAASHIESGG